MIPPIKIKKLYPDTKIPMRANPSDSGLDVYVHHFEKVYSKKHDLHLEREEPFTHEFNEGSMPISLVLKTNDRVLINTGISATVGVGYEIQVRSRSGNALKRGLIVTNQPGTIDNAYRGHLNVIITNIGHETQVIEVGEKIAQIVVCPIILSEVVEVESLDETDRGANGFGSTGTK